MKKDDVGWFDSLNLLVGYPAEGCQYTALVCVRPCLSACPVKFTIVTSEAHLTGVAISIQKAASAKTPPPTPSPTSVSSHADSETDA